VITISVIVNKQSPIQLASWAAADIPDAVWGLPAPASQRATDPLSEMVARGDAPWSDSDQVEGLCA